MARELQSAATLYDVGFNHSRHAPSACQGGDLIPDDSDVVVDTNGNTVMLNGHVRTWAEHDAVVDAAWMATGVYDVRDELHITG